MHFGFPECVEKNKPDPDLVNTTGIEELCAKREPSVFNFQAHAAALGIHFYKGDMFPAEWKNRAIVAEHGSWNRVPFSGYKVSWFNIDEQNKIDKHGVFTGGFLRNGKIAGRPVDIAELRDGSLLISDDFSNKIYRVFYRDPKKPHKKWVDPEE